ncbi:MAG: DNA polymerase Y family protein [Actinomycetota bacterium]|nr:DNA polymerase Y family protein [Actinomycetota bacterium]
MTPPPRTLVVWCPDWPVTAAGLDADVPGAVVFANRVVACSAAARAAGIRRGLRRREAQGRCPDLVVLAHDPARDARAFEPVVAAVEAFAPLVQILRPGVCAVGTRGPARYFGGEEALAHRLGSAVGRVCRVGIADGAFAAALAAKGALIVAPGETRAFLAPFPVSTLERPPLADVLVRLGIGTLGAFAALPPSDVLARFGPDGALALRLAQGLDERPSAGRRPPPDLAVHVELDPPAQRVDSAAFAGKALADELHRRLAQLGLACLRVTIECETEHGERLARVWRHHGALTPSAMAERVRWQLDGWLGGTAGEAHPSAGLSLLRLVPDQVVADDGRQLGFWGEAAAPADRASRALARVQGMLGPQAVTTALPSGGRSPGEQVTLVPWGDVGEPARPPSPPWPGRLPSPSPATVFTEARPAEVVGADGAVVGVTGRCAVTAAPVRVSVAGDRWWEVVAWAGPWPMDERWWDRPAHRRRARFQAVVADGSAWLLVLEGGRWWAEATYD